MNGSGEVVLRNALFQAGAVRVGRARSGQVAPESASASVAPVQPRLDEALSREAADAEALREATEEGLRQGRAEGIRLGAEEGRRTGYEEGLALGREAAQAEGRKALEAARAEAIRPLEEKSRRLENAAAALEAQAQAYGAAAEEELVALCYEVLGRLLGQALATPAGLQAQVRQLLATSGRSGEISVHVHPEDLQLVEQARSGDASDASDAGGRRLRYVADDRVALGGCVLRGGGAGEVDARLETILQQCKDAFLGARAAREAEPAGMSMAKGAA
ncbi:FliH/SctL family protein [Ramlibacter pallidus]|uniref:Flagellar assembly protein FliH n=1 Tax=Ramlibacter pallidus TaxID=2780087 RepID=A0ABR9S1M0_9BURK|nr:FliH/SctL family protein [Ramlibacter pallidus]MBE7367192.1 hypothetical protein [Ramlibacter pallidus]